MANVENIEEMLPKLAEAERLQKAMMHYAFADLIKDVRTIAEHIVNEEHARRLRDEAADD